MDQTKAKKLLVVEDDENQRNSIRDLVGNSTAKVVEAPDGSAALQLLRSEPVDCVVLDLMLPDMSGFELIEKIRTENEHLPIIVYTARDLTQEFFARLLQRNDLAEVSPERGRFRSFLLASFKHLLANEYHRQQTQKRGGRAIIVSYQRFTFGKSVRST